jgi:hypothetical protein
MAIWVKEFTMSQLNMKEIEQRVQRSFYQDGLLELGAGLYFFLIGLIIGHKLSAAFLPLMIFGLKPAVEAAKRWLIYPRIGYVKFHEEENYDIKGFGRGVIILAILAVTSPFICILILGKGPGWEFWTRRFLPFYMGFLTAIGLFVGARKFIVFRWYIFAAVAVAAGLGVPFLGLESIYTPIAIQFQIIGGTMFLTGLVMCTAFLIKYPVEKQLPEDANEPG